MPNIHEMVPSTSKYLAKDDVPQPMRVTVANVTAENVARDNEPAEIKAILTFDSPTMKPMVLNKTNQNTMEALYGPMTENWLNRTIIIYNDPTIQMQGRITGGLRLRMDQAAVTPAPVPPVVPAAPQAGSTPIDTGYHAEFDDDIPFG